MANIQDYIKLSHSASLVKEIFIESSEFHAKYLTIHENEKKSYVRYYVVNNIPFAFRDRPILYEQLTQYLADKLQISTSEIKLIGSAKTGFSMSPPPSYGRIFGTHSDLDFSIVHEDLFYTLESEYLNWVDLFKEKRMMPKNEKEEKYWVQNLDSGIRQIERGFFDTHFLPNRYDFPINQNINNSLALIKINLEKTYAINVKKVSASVYKSWTSFSLRLNRNTALVMKQILK